MKKNDNGQGQEFDINDSYNLNTDENVGGNQHLNEPIEDESEIEKLKEAISLA